MGRMASSIVIRLDEQEPGGIISLLANIESGAARFLHACEGIGQRRRFECLDGLRLDMYTHDQDQHRLVRLRQHDPATTSPCLPFFKTATCPIKKAPDIAGAKKFMLTGVLSAQTSLKKRSDPSPEPFA